jgi:hypothetical protein
MVNCSCSRNDTYSHVGISVCIQPSSFISVLCSIFYCRGGLPSNDSYVIIQLQTGKNFISVASSNFPFHCHGVVTHFICFIAGRFLYSFRLVSLNPLKVCDMLKTELIRYSMSILFCISTLNCKYACWYSLMLVYLSRMKPQSAVCCVKV